MYINHHRPKGQLIEMMALIHDEKFITRLMGEPTRLSLHAVNRQRGTFWAVLKQFLTVRVEEDTFQEI